MGSKSQDNNDRDLVKKVFTHKGRYVQYSLYGNLFEVSSKYVPPLRPIGRGAYGIVWLVSLSQLPFLFFLMLWIKLTYLCLYIDIHIRLFEKTHINSF